ncbi:PCI domain-containing protein [Caldalkalibacillus mannanilyticus]|uniref:PCI domain-containing protein n=1 Tax=Caldalkalibacillus mannanilyticus TaxID=1418 RepID=UPI0011DC9086|nr:hypothetical protein [Caldalkalibacillus mannanilyticus]
MFALLAYFMDENIVTTVFGIAGVLFFILGIMLQKRAKRVRQNIDLIANKKITNLDQMAAMTGVSFADLQKELTQMIREGFINGQIKQSSREIVINKSQSQTRNTEAQNASQAAQVKQVSCKSCGAHTTMALHETKECEYCGMLIAGSE